MLDNIEVLCHSSIRISKNKVIYIDPYKIEENYNDADIIFLTHDHYDHYSEEDIDKVINKNTIIVIPEEMIAKLLRKGIDKNSILVVKPNEEYMVQGIKFETIPSYNVNKKFHPKENNWVGYIITIDEVRYYIAGDTDITEEDISIVKNPDRGLYKLVQVELQNEEENFDDFEKKVDEINENDKEVSLILLELNLKNYVQENNISKNKITEINKYFSIMREHGYKVIFRVVYDSEGTKNPEPEFDMLLKQIEQLKDIYVSNKDIIFVVEAGFLGTNGEWINGKYDKYMTEKNKIIEKLLEIVPEEIQISFRKPTYITDYLSSKNTVTESNAFSTDIISRFGLYNSGYLESETDSDTYNKLERTESINWQGLQTKYTIFGGEAKNWKSNYNDLENAIKDMFIRHCTYLNKNADENVIEKWKGTLYTGTEEIYNRKSGYVYIQNHLGYRLLLTNVKFNGTEAGKNAEVSINLENIGFGNILKEKTITLIYKNTSNTYKIETNIDIRKQLKDGNYVLQINEKLPDDMKDGEYNVYLSIG